jgi:hypothetical protein
MSTTHTRLSRTILLAAVCVASAAAFAKPAQRPATPSDTVSSVLLSDDERVEFCTQMNRASTPDERQDVAEHLRDTLIPRAKAKNVTLPSWLLNGAPTKGYGAPGNSIPGLACDTGSAKPRAKPAPPGRETPEQKMPNREPSEQKTPSRETADQKATPAPDVSRGDIPIGHDRGIAYVTGGVGQDEAATLRGLAKGYSMRATFMTGTGEYLSGVAVEVSRSDGTVVFAARSEGPYLFAQLPPGHYRVAATFDGTGRTRAILVPSRGSIRFTLVWPASFSPG